ncbi:molecular chaperone DnaJ [candidate division WWE3 bacterium]|uniref:Chaperone protein DnaJ n=1 Tax=candidate division WWE3 bacterium TaxID=2053526 RepID=A0A955RPS8_UNCKA|nr:molecular chaperone DnaJ [candidate division WWE3 bacterium]
MAKDYYQILGVEKKATKDEIKKAYKKLAKQYHPDLNKEADAEKKFKEVSEAYQVLSDEQKRSTYDQVGHDAFTRGGGNNAGAGFGGFGQGFGGFSGSDNFVDPFEIFEQFFGGGFGGGSRRSRRSQGQSLEARVDLTFDEAVHGTEKTLTYSRYDVCDVCSGSGAKEGTSAKTCATCNGQGRVRTQQSMLGAMFSSVADCPDCQGTGETIEDPCSNCRGTGRFQKQEDFTFKVPAGVDTGTRIRFSGRGSAGERSGVTGDLYVSFKVKPHKLFERKNQNIYLSVPVSYSQAALGDTITVPTIHGEESVDLPAGTQPGAQIKLSDKGVAYPNSKRMGDQIITVAIETPKKLSKEEKKLFEQLKALEKKPKKWWEKIIS